MVAISATISTDMDRQQLDKLTIDELLAKLSLYGLPGKDTREKCIDALMSHYERHEVTSEYHGWSNASTSAECGTPPAGGGSKHASCGNPAISTIEETLRLLTEQMRVLLTQNAVNPPNIRDSNPGPPTTSAPPVSQDVISPMSSLHTGQTVKLLATLIPSFSGLEDEDVQIWIDKVDRVATIYGVSDGVKLLAASSKLLKRARDWLDQDTGQVNTSWVSFKEGLLRRFKRYVSFQAAMQKIDARRWNYGKETFHEYASQKLKLMHHLKLSEQDKIELLINGIGSLSVRSAAAMLDAQTMDEFLKKMDKATSCCGIVAKKSSPVPIRKEKFKDTSSSSTESSSPSGTSKDVSCAYCKARGHTKDDCFKLKRKDQHAVSSTSSVAASKSVAAASSGDSGVTVSYEDTDAATQVGCVADGSTLKLDEGNPIVEVTSINNSACSLLALIDTGSPASFILSSVHKIFFGQYSKLSKSIHDNFKTLSNANIDVVGFCSAKIGLTSLPNILLKVDLRVIENTSWSTHIVLGRDFLAANKLTLLYSPLSSNDNDDATRVKLFEEVASADVCQVDDNMQNENDIKTDFDKNVDSKLHSLLKDIESTPVVPIEDNYSVKIALKDDSIYAYAPRKFAHVERIQIRDITDDLLKREIIKPSTSPYCARVVPVRKKNGRLRLCVDLRPLNDRVLKQKYPFPVIENCLAVLGGKRIFTLLDLKDSFHLIRIHPDFTKYFSFATPDGQFEYLRLPFGFSEAPAEFQRRINYILQPLIREEKILVYMDDILIPSETIEENLDTLKRTLTLLKQYGFTVNFDKCQFLKESVEYLGYSLSPSGITLSERHVEAVKRFPIPTTVVQVQRFLGLTNYFRKFIYDYASKARALNNLLRKNVKFKFDDDCVKSFETLKSELTSYPVLRLYQSGLETELHTDASSIATAAILMQRQENGTLAPIAYASQANNEAEKRYHSYELEMMAIVKAVERFHIYLYGIDFKVVTDCNALVFAVNKASINPRIARWVLRLQNYSFKIEHRSGQKMTHVDALSRIVATVDSMPLEKELQFRQLADPSIRLLAQSIEESDHDKFELIDGLVYRKDADHPKFVVPESMIFQLIRIYHDDMAHCGLEKTYQGLFKNYWFTSMRRKIKAYIDNCVVCLVTNTASNVNEGELQITPTVEKPFEIVHTDHFGPLVKSEKGFKHILILIDSCTRFTWLFPVKSTSSREVIEKFTPIFDMCGNPRQIISDRGTAFSSTEFSEFLHSRNIVQHLVAVAAPWANGLVERANRFLKSSLKKIIDDHMDWPEAIPAIQYVINNTYHTSIKSSPAKLLFGFDQRNHADVKLTKFLSDRVKTDLTCEKDRDDSRHLASITTNRIKQYNKIYYDKRHKTPTMYNSGDHVMIRDTTIKPGEEKKFKSAFKGPYLVDKVLSKNRYVIKDVPGHNNNPRPYNSILSPDRMKLWARCD